jgi:plastocyanin
VDLSNTRRPAIISLKIPMIGTSYLLLSFISIKRNGGQNMRYTNMIAIGLVIMLTAFGCGKDDNNNPTDPNNPPPGGNSVTISNFSFSPSNLTVSAGTTVTWTNNDAVAHTSTSNSGAWDSGNIAQGGTFSFTFDSTGTYPYHCTPHPQMTGQIIVQ